MKRETTTTATDDEAVQLAKRLASRKGKERESDLAQVDIQTLLPILEQEARKYRRGKRTIDAIFNVSSLLIYSMPLLYLYSVPVCQDSKSPFLSYVFASLCRFA